MKGPLITSRTLSLFDRLDKSLVRVRDDGMPDPDFTPGTMPVTSRLLDALEQAGMAAPSMEPRATLHTRFAEWLLSVPDSALQPIGFGKQMPPRGVHTVREAWNLPMDFRNCDIMCDALHKAGLVFEPGGCYLDFGCSSGRTVRTFGLAYPESRWFGCDPVPSSIEWAAERYASVKFEVSGQQPPTGFADGEFDGVYAKSVWTHYGPKAGAEWLAELARITKPGGFILFTAHGHHDLARRIMYNDPSPKYTRLAKMPRLALKDRLLAAVAGGTSRLKRLAPALHGYTDHLSKLGHLSTVVEELTGSGYFFRPYRQNFRQWDLGHIEDADTSQWGLAFMTPEWVRHRLLPPGVRLLHHAVGRTGLRQDIYILERN